MDQYQQDKAFEIKFSPLSTNYLGVLSNRDIQIFELGSGAQIPPQRGLKTSTSQPNFTMMDEVQNQQKFKLKAIVDIDQILTFEWSKIKSQPMQIIAAKFNGKISLININPKQLQLSQALGNTNQTNVVLTGKIEKEFFTRSMKQNYRQCNALSWNSIDKHIFAAGYDSSRNEPSLYIWDINKTVNPSYNMMLDEDISSQNISSNQFAAKLEQKQRPEIILEPKLQFQKVHDDIYSISWFPDSDSELIYGTDKFLRICDTKQAYQCKSLLEESHNTQVLGIKFDPFDSRRFASFSEDCIKIFDLRYSKKPQCQIRPDNPCINGFEWSLYRPNLISSFNKKSNIVEFWDLSIDESTYKHGYSQPSQSSKQGLETIIKYPLKQFDSIDEVVGITWKPKSQQDKNKFYVYSKGGIIEEKMYIEKEQFFFDLSARGNICMSNKDRKTLHSISFFDAYINYDRLAHKYLSDRELTNTKINEYSEEGPGFVDTQNQIINRVKGGYNLDTIERNYNLCQSFRFGSNQYGQMSETQLQQFKYYRGIKSFWSWMKRIQVSDQYQFLDGILQQLDMNIFDVSSPHFTKENQQDQSGQDSYEEILSLKIYNSESRSSVIKFCGWTDYAKLDQHQYDQQKSKTSSTHYNYQQIQQQAAHINQEIQKVCSAIESEESHFQGGSARASIVAAFHLDFMGAMRFSSSTEPLQKNREEPNNIQVLNNTLRTLKDIKKNASQMSESQMNEKLKSLSEFTKNMFSQMKNPYFIAFFKFLEGTQMFQVWCQDPRINFLDQIAILCRFFKIKDIQAYFTQQLTGKNSLIDEGSLEAIALVGLKNPQIIRVIQNYVDKYGDIQTAAYISAFVLQLSVIHQTQEQFAPLKKYISEYRNFLNQLQLWNVRAEFDVALGQLERNSFFQKYEKWIKSQKDNDHVSFKSEQQNLNFFSNDKEVKLIGQQETQLPYKYGYTADPFDKAPYESIAKCYFCGVAFSIKSHLQKFANELQLPKHKSDKAIINQCPSCSKMTPNCSVCLQPIGLLNPQIEVLNKAKYMQLMGGQAYSKIRAGPLPQKQQTEETQNKQSTIIMNRQLDEWMVWCQTCKHGGHAAHIIEWFKNQTDCPVSNCSCDCTFKN